MSGSPQERAEYDVLVAGGGPVGACVAALLANAADGRPARVGLLEPRAAAMPAPGTPLDARVVALSRAAERILGACGAWAQLPAARLCPIERMRVWHESTAPRSPGELAFAAAEAGEPNLGWIAEIPALQAAALAAFDAAGGTRLPLGLTGIQMAAEGVTVMTGAGPIGARLLVGADGAASAVRQAAGLAADITPCGQTAIVARILTARAHEHTAWQRFMSQGTLGMLPLADGAVAIVWSADEPLAERLLGLEPEAFARELEGACAHVLGPLRLEGERRAFPLRRIEAQRYVAGRIALVGDAAHVIHPLAGQGMNLGFLDAAALAQQVSAARRAGEDPGAFGVLRAYERWRKSELAPMTAAMAAFDRLLAHGQGPVARLAQRSLSWVNRSPELKRLFIARALGIAGEVPELVRRPG